MSAEIYGGMICDEIILLGRASHALLEFVSILWLWSSIWQFEVGMKDSLYCLF